MCRGWQEGDYEIHEYPGMTRGPLKMDKCIAPILSALNAYGIRTTASCCGHGVRPGSIILADGREFIIAPDYDTARIAERAFPPLNPSGDARSDPVAPYAVKLLDGLHHIFTQHGIASRQMESLVTDVVQWAARACRDSMPKALNDAEVDAFLAAQPPADPLKTARIRARMAAPAPAIERFRVDQYERFHRADPLVSAEDGEWVRYTDARTLLETAQQELREALARERHYLDTEADLRKQAEQAKQRAQALLGYVQHARTCQKWFWPKAEILKNGINLNPSQPCTCGLDKLLTQKGTR